MTVPARSWHRLAAPYAMLRLSGQGLEFVGWVLLARRLAPGPFGELAIAFLVCRYLGVIADWGAQWRGPRDVAARGRLGSVRALVRRRTVLAPIFAAVVAAAMVAIGHAPLAPAALVVLSMGLTRDWIALGLGRGAVAGFPSLVQGALLLAGAAMVTKPGPAAVVVAVAYLCAAAISVALNRIPPDGDDAAPDVRPDAWLLSAFLAIQVLSTTDIVLLGVLRSSAEAGTYAAVYRFPNAWVAVLGALLASLAPSATAAFHDDRNGFHALARRSLRASTVAGAVVACSAPALVWVSMTLLGPDYADGRLPAAILTLATAVITLAAPLHPLAMATGHDRRYATIVIAGSAGNVALNLAVIPHFGMAGAATATLLAQVLITIGLWRMVPGARVFSAPLTAHDAA
jgi:O-antigen/teichoic acid export membrane protein